MIQNHKDSKFRNFLQEYRQEIKFVLIFSGGLLLIFNILYTNWMSKHFTQVVTEFETVIASSMLNLIGFENTHEGLYIVGGGGNAWRMQVLNTCNGLFESAIFLLAFVAIQIPWRRKLPWMLGGFLFFHLINELRLVSLFIVGSNYSHDTFVFFHETFWNFAIVLVALGTFIFCAYQVSKTPAMNEAPSEPAKI